MTGHLSTLLVIGLPVLVLLAGASVLFFKRRDGASILQLLGAACLMITVLTHVAEAFGLAPWMGWGFPNSPGHYIDLLSVVLGATAFPLGYLAHALTW